MTINIDFNDSTVEWYYNGNPIFIKLGNIIIASLDELNNLVLVQTGDDFIVEREYIYNLNGDLLMFNDKKIGLVEWSSSKDKKELLKVDNLIQVGYYPAMNLVLIMYLANNKEIMALNLNGEYLYEIKEPANYKMMYLQQFRNYISVVCDGDSNYRDDFGRGRINFKLDIQTGTLIKEGLSY